MGERRLILKSHFTGHAFCSSCALRRLAIVERDRRPPLKAHRRAVNFPLARADPLAEEGGQWCGNRGGQRWS